MSEDIRVFENFLPARAYDSLAAFVSSEPMAYGSRSNFKTDPHGHWSRAFVAAGRHNLADVAPLLEQREDFAPLRSAWHFLRDNHLANSVLIRCYLNGYTYGTDGYFHADSERLDETTTIVYLTDHWEPDWAGETAFLDKQGDIIKSVLPKRNRAVTFPADVLHAGRGVSRKCTILRRTLIFKTRRTRSPNFEKLSTFLRNAGAVDRSHKSGSLHDHLVRTFALLEAKGCPESLCFGGGLHSVYGTNAFGPGILRPTEKSAIVENFGGRAEELACLFSQIERPAALESPVNLNVDSATVALSNGQVQNLAREIFDELRTIEAANLADQQSLRKYPALRNWWNLLSP
jgi:SM-20-related protein